MSSAQKAATDIDEFILKARQPHRRINPCFMTGKGCVHTEHIDIALDSRADTKTVSGFNVRPFQPNIETAHNLSLKRYMLSHYSIQDKCKLHLDEADKVRRTGYIVCEKICRRIQSSDFVVVDISAPNANVFYELGLAYGIDQKILVVRQEDSTFGKEAEKYLKDGGCRCYPYRDLNPITPNDFQLSNHIWSRTNIPLQKSRSAPTIALITKSYGFLAWHRDSNSQYLESSETQLRNTKELFESILGIADISLGFETHVMAAVGVAVDNIVQKQPIMKKYIDLVNGLKNTDLIKKEASFYEVRQKVEQSFCTIIQTGGKIGDPMAYFWLGYCHALGKNVIPVTVVDTADDDVDDLAFDLRALWHMSFIRNEPYRFSQELEETLHQMITSDFSEWSRRHFWDEVLGRRGKVSIFTGALHNPIGREMIGDWDLRAASELTSYFASHQYRATIESPVYQIEQVTSSDHEQIQNVTENDYISELKKMIGGKNCIVIASPDVNPLTEILLGQLYDVEDKSWFRSSVNFKNDIEQATGVVIAFKEVETSKETNSEAKKGTQIRTKNPDSSRAFYRRIPKKETPNKKRHRGFLGHGVEGGKLQGEFLSQTDKKDSFVVHAHLVVARNPFDSDKMEPHHIIILNGVSGPATFALTHVLTGGTSSQFVAYKKEFLPDDRSEEFLQQLNQDLEMLKDRSLGIQYFFRVEVGPTPAPDSDTKTNKHLGRDIFDWRRILHWERVANKSECSFGQPLVKNRARPSVTPRSDPS